MINKMKSKQTILICLIFLILSSACAKKEEVHKDGLFRDEGFKSYDRKWNVNWSKLEKKKSVDELYNSNEIKAVRLAEMFE